MIKLTDIRKIIKLTIISGYIKNTDRPISLLLIGKSGIGKSEVTTYYYGKKVLRMTDVSYFGICNEINKNPEVKHLLIPDFLKVTRKNKNTSDNVIGILCSFMEEGVGKIHLNKQEYDFKGKRLGIITSTTQASFSQNQYIWETIGFIQRFLICSYAYTNETRDEVMKYINDENYLLEANKEKITGTNKFIKSTPELNAQLRIISKDSFRLQKHLQTLVKCNAFLRGDDKVIQEDINEIIRLSGYLNFDFTEI